MSEPENAGVSGGDEEPILWKDRRLEERALRERWPMSEEVRIRILKRCASYIDPETEDGADAKPRTVLMAAKVIMSADKLNLEDRRLNMADGMGPGDSATTDVIGEAVRIRGERKKRLADAPA